MTGNKSRTCCFTGPRRLPKGKIKHIVIRLNQEVDRLIGEGVTDFLSGGALGFDQLAASLILAKKEMGNLIRLIFALPCKNQDEFWKAEQKKLYHDLLAEADEVVYVSEEYTNGSMKKRNRYMVDRSACCICVLLHPLSGTAQTMRFAREKGLKIHVTEDYREAAFRALRGSHRNPLTLKGPGTEGAAGRPAVLAVSGGYGTHSGWCRGFF